MPDDTGPEALRRHRSALLRFADALADLLDALEPAPPGEADAWRARAGRAADATHYAAEVNRASAPAALALGVADRLYERRLPARLRTAGTAAALVAEWHRSLDPGARVRPAELVARCQRGAGRLDALLDVPRRTPLPRRIAATAVRHAGLVTTAVLTSVATAVAVRLLGLGR
jgi:hypothetical protein